jgi:hypothetical protein
MKFWFFIGPMFNNSNSYGFIFSYTLLWGRLFSFFKCQTYLPRCKLWMDITYYSCKRGKIFFCMFIPPYWPRFILWLLQIYTHLDSRSYYFICGYSNCFFRVCFTLRANIFLGRYSYYKFIFSYSLYW